MIQTRRKIPVLSKRDSKINKNLLKFLINTNQPISIVENEYFKDHLKSLDPSYESPKHYNL